MKHLILWGLACLLTHDSVAFDNPLSIDLGRILTFSKTEMLTKKRSQSVRVIQPETVYDLSSSNVRWDKGYTTLFVGVRQKTFPQKEFLKHLTQHVRDVDSNFKKIGLNGYIFSATEDYEIAWQHWTSKSAADRAFQSIQGKRIVQDAMSIMENEFYKPMNWSSKNPTTVLIVVTSHEDLGTTGRKTGFYLSEVTHPYFKLSEAGINVQFASPQGGKAPMDEHSRTVEDTENKKFLTDKNLLSQLERTLKLSEVKAEDYSGILFAGGHGTMWDFPNSPELARLTANIYEQGGIVSAICHGPAALVDIKLSNGKYLIAGKKLTSFTDAEETEVKLQDTVPFSLEKKLIERGGRFQEGKNWSDHVVIDGKLVTAQNPQSAATLGNALAKMLTQ